LANKETNKEEKLVKKRILWVGLSFLLAASLVLASCGEEIILNKEKKIVKKKCVWLMLSC